MVNVKGGAYGGSNPENRRHELPTLRHAGEKSSRFGPRRLPVRCEGGAATITFDEAKVKRDEIEKAVVKAGYTVSGSDEWKATTTVESGK